MKIGLIGYGVMGRNHARIVASDDRHELIGIHDLRFSSDEGAIFKRSVGELIESGMQACILSVPPNQTKKLALSLADYRIPTLIEKPLSDSYRGATEITAAFHKTETFASVGYIERFNQAVIKAKELIISGDLGKVLEISSIRLGYLGNRSPIVGVELDLLVHDLDLIKFLTEKRIIESKAIRTSFIQKGISDTVTVVGLLEDNTHFSIRANWISPFKKREFAITGERGTLVINTLDMGVRLYMNGTVESYWDELTSIRGVTQGNEINFALTRKEPLKMQFESFILGIQGVETHSASLTEASNLLSDLEKFFYQELEI